LCIRKSVRIIGTRCYILRLKCTKFDIGWGSAPESAGELTALPRPSGWIQGVLLPRERGKKQKRKGKEEEGKGEGKREKKGKRGRSEEDIHLD